jgi:hypothetical protein
MQPSGIDTSNMVLAAWLCFLVSCFFAVRRPAANALLNLTLIGVGEAPLALGFTSARLSAIVALMTVLMLLIRPKRHAAVPLNLMVHTPLAWLGCVYLAILAKILFESAVYGINAARTANLEMGLCEVGLPIVILLLSLAKDGPEGTARDILIGMATFPALMLCGYFPYAVNAGQLQGVSSGLGRFGIGGADEINSARVMCWGAIGSFLLFSLRRNRNQGNAKNVLCLSVSCFLVLLTLITGNRQYLFALLGFVVLWGIWLKGANYLRTMVRVILFLCFALGAYKIVTFGNLALKDRLSEEAIEMEKTEGRGEIWGDALKSVFQHPILGAGFKNFGGESDAVDRTGSIIVMRDSAHGVIQDVFVEHGIVLGAAFFAGCLLLVKRALYGFQRQRQLTAEMALTVASLAMIPPLLFSSVFLNAMPIYWLLILTMARDSRPQLKRGGPNVPKRLRAQLRL